MEAVVVIPASITPSGFGINERLEDEQLVAVGSCCGGQVLYSTGGNTRVQCSDCKAVFKNRAEARASSFYLDSMGTMENIVSWVSHWTGWEEEDLSAERLD